MEWDLFNFEKVIEEIKKPKVEKRYTNKEYKEYIIKNFKPDYYNQVFYNIILTSYFGNDELEYKTEPKIQLQWFKKLYNSFTYHFQNDKVTIFSMKHIWDNAPSEYSVFIAIKNDFILKATRVHDLFKDEMCLPACAISWFNPDGTFADMNKVLVMTEEESAIWKEFVTSGNEIINPKDTSAFTFNEWWRDRREYYCFCKLKLHKFGKPCRVFEKHTYDNFADYTFKLVDLINYFSEVGDSE